MDRKSGHTKYVMKKIINTPQWFLISKVTSINHVGVLFVTFSQLGNLMTRWLILYIY